VGAKLIAATSFEEDPTWLPTFAADFQRRNAGTAYAAIAALRQQGFTIPESAVIEGLANARLPGRLERMPTDDPFVWLDGAHNADKMAALASEVRRINSNRPLPVVVLGVLGAKDASAMAAGLNGMASTVVVTEPRVIGKTALPTSSLTRVLRASGFLGEILSEENAVCALEAAQSVARSQGSDVLVTGSLYLVGQLRRCWYPDELIVVQRTSWPVVTHRADLAFA
jgi:dihydrofolate synthase/folylpolyglutamate synthase